MSLSSHKNNMPKVYVEGFALLQHLLPELCAPEINEICQKEYVKK